MAISKILLYYAFTPLADPEAIRLWQRDLASSLGLRGRILISKDGINGTIGGELNAVKRYLRSTREYGPFRDLDAKFSDGSGLIEEAWRVAAQPTGSATLSRLVSTDFPRLSVKVREEIVSFGAPDELEVDSGGVVGGGIRLSPEQVNELVDQRPDAVFFDGRNRFEAEIGRFKNAIVPDVDNTREFVAELDSGAFDHLKDKPVITYCTGGIRCEVLSAHMKARGFSDVYQIDGGIVRYGEAFGDAGLWEGSLYVFDERMSLDFGESPAVLGTCTRCEAPTKHMQNCVETACRTQLVVCERCARTSVACEDHAARPSPGSPTRRAEAGLTGTTP
ncbi:rhodanese-related sulfurtransferase [Homoserinimonas sp. OAct 916]|uniref:oxygen-dependent tRNA uridine(34) hydroxylase TrhO n=1 Tax=Homoserinimonas sp. OAct 916 TaxID=2211450 RepID=UPI000DBE05F7|nr:rhodanese-related sulfurtransferase [Homoserinimonas sp. OAct 916]